MTDTRGSIYPADQLLAWLEQHRSDPARLGSEVELRLPVYVTLSANKMDVEAARVGIKPDGLVIQINDSTLNIPIAGKLPMFFGEGADKGLVSLRGYWRGGDSKEFQVTRVEGAADASAATSAELVQ